MIFTPFDLKDFLDVCKAEIAAINYVSVVIDDSKMTADLSNVSEDDNLLLYGVLPDYGGDSNDEEALMFDNGLDFLVLKKVEYSDLNNDDFLAVMQETLLVARELIKKVYEQKNKPGGCSSFAFLKEGKEQITPVWAKAGTNGYMVSFNLRTSL